LTPLVRDGAAGLVEIHLGGNSHSRTAIRIVEIQRSRTLQRRAEAIREYSEGSPRRC